MVDLNALTQADVGREVIYRGNVGEVERGIIKGWGKQSVYVRYERYGWVQRGELPRYQEGAQSTDPADLTFVDGQP